jgi:alpha-galactosidase
MNRFLRGLAASLVVVPVAAFAVMSGTQAASAENNGVGLTPLMGWSTWNVPGSNPTAADDEAAALALKNSGLLAAGYN